MSTIAAVVMYPIHVTNQWLDNSSSVIPTFVRDRMSLENRIQELENELTIARRNDVTRNRLSDENNRLRSLLGVDSENRVAAAVIARPDELPYDLLQIDRGSDHGVVVGAPVYLGKDNVLGLVVHTATNYAFVELISSPNFTATAFLSGANVVVGLRGLGGGVARISVPQGIPVTVGDLVYLPSIEPGVYGRVSYVENEPTQPEQYGYITPELSLSSVHQVAVGNLTQITQSPDEINEQIQARIQSSLIISDLVIATSSTSTIEAAQGTTTEEINDL
jgi:cell shape-determining protein MreC